MSEAPLRARLAIALGGLLLATAVALGAAGAHGLKPLLIANDPAGWFETARRYHELHALGLISIGLAISRWPASRWLTASAILLLAGIVLFSGSLYLRSLAGLHAVRTLTPLGGIAFMAGWLALAVAALTSPFRR